MTDRRATRFPELWILTACSAALHFWRLFTPRAVVFDELYYEKFAGYYLTHSFFFDVHPPLGRLLFTALAALLGVPSRELLLPLSVPELRILPALFGVALVPLVFALLLQLGASRRAATLAAFAITFDNALLVMSRVILPDIFLIVFGLASISAYLAARRREGSSRLAWTALSAFLGGCAFSVKWTGASGIGVVLAIWLADAVVGRATLRATARRRLIELAVLVVVPAAVYLGAWQIHFALLTRTGPGDTFMPRRFQLQLPGAVQYDPRVPPLSFWTKLSEVHHAIRYGNGSLQNVTHPASSPWYTWPVMKHPMAFWETARARDGSIGTIILLGNPVVWWGGLIGAGAGALLFLFRRRRFVASGAEFGFLVLLGATLLNYVPFMAITRVMFLYHYLFALVVLVSLSAYSTGLAAGWGSGGEPVWTLRGRQRVLVGVLLALMFVSFLYFSPFSYGMTLSASAWDQRFWVLHPSF